MPSPLDAKLSNTLGGRTAGAFERALGLRTVGDLLHHFPRRYARRGELTALDELEVGASVTIVAEVLRTSERRMQQRRGSILEVAISDGRGILTLTFFNQAWRKNELVPGARGIFAGKVGEYRGTRQLAHPDYELFERDPDGGVGASSPAGADAASPDAARWAMQPIPIYPATSTVASWQLQRAIGVVLDTLPPLDDPVPATIRRREQLMDYAKALDAVHRPERDEDHRRARDALRYQEAFVLQTALLRERAKRREHAAAVRTPGRRSAEFHAHLPFELTDDQQRVGAEIEADLASGVPMNRLVQGEVGSGKTLVALRAMLAVADSGGQAALLAPTEVLAAQHLRSIVASLGPDLAAALRPTLLTGGLSTAERRKALLAAAAGSSSIIVGTHALLSDNVTFADLGLVVVDEQHRFGVDQREALRLKGSQAPHVLVLTATPIPRTVAMTVFGDLDVSTITQLPAGRTPITSHVVPLAERPGWLTRAWERIGEELDQGRQAFVVCPAIEPGALDDTGDEVVDDDRAEVSEGDSAQTEAAVARIANVLEVTQLLREGPALHGRRIEALHGRLSSDDKDRIMREFARGAIDVLVATTVVEVGVDVPNASTMVILDADRFGVSQLHQLRGRVGRGGVPGLCLFVTRAPLGTVARERVDAVASTLDGFELAQIDLELRREGDVLGSEQSGGRSSLKLLRVAHDGELIGEARAAAESVLADDPELDAHPALRGALRRRLDETAQTFLAKN
ncbi:ATP-dependent DNA helicase RecG [Ruicaihuangia caeni]|uniref:ATP-dependent DNA helicase RecG n=1 Tax=Ruicaihuangia caeni TaxID=3042517 RepID=UPI00338F587C